MSEFDREKYGDYEEAMRRLMTDPIFDEASEPETAQEASREEPAAEEAFASARAREDASASAPEAAEPEASDAPETERDEREETFSPPEQSEEYLPVVAAPAAEDDKKKRRDPVTSVFEWVESAIFAVVVVILLFTFVFRIVGIDGRSMVPTLQDEDRVVISNLFYTPKTGDIVVLDTSEDTIYFNGRQYSKPLIKRVIATGGQTVKVTTSENGLQEVYVDGVKLNEDYINLQTVSHSPGQEELTVPKGSVFVMGDNRGESLDSRSFGCISENAIVGRALFRIFPLSEMGLLTTDDPYGQH